MTTPRRPGVRGGAPVPVRVTSHYQDALFARGQETITCTLVASRIGQMEHEPINARPMLLRDDAIYAKTMLMSLALLQPVKGAVVGLQWALRMHGFDDNAPGGIPPV